MKILNDLLPSFKGNDFQVKSVTPSPGVLRRVNGWKIKMPYRCMGCNNENSLWQSGGIKRAFLKRHYEIQEQIEALRGWW
jgi:hypothetical protein